MAGNQKRFSVSHINKQHTLEDWEEMSGKLVSQLKDEETIENALKSCLENVRSMKSGAVLTEVLALLKNDS